ncbi:MAG: hypothetical protein ACRDY7_17415, partial [Acidimicrobiia bacterium]
MMRRLAAAGLALALISVACSDGAESPAQVGGEASGDDLAAAVASYDVARPHVLEVADRPDPRGQGAAASGPYVREGRADAYFPP